MLIADEMRSASLRGGLRRLDDWPIVSAIFHVMLG
jgi:hypothetical protein